MRVLPSILLTAVISGVPAMAGAQANSFDGTWNVTLTCPPTSEKEGAKGYTHKFPAEVKDGHLLGGYGKEGELGWQRLQGQIGADGSADLTLDGIVSNTDYAIGRSPTGKAFRYQVRATFEWSVGTGQRTSGRVCEFRFAR